MVGKSQGYNKLYGAGGGGAEVVTYFMLPLISVACIIGGTRALPHGLALFSTANVASCIYTYILYIVYVIYIYIWVLYIII